MASAIAMYPVNLSQHVNTSMHRPCMPSYVQTQGRAQGGVGRRGGEEGIRAFHACLFTFDCKHISFLLGYIWVLVPCSICQLGDDAIFVAEDFNSLMCVTRCVSSVSNAARSTFGPGARAKVRARTHSRRVK